jgi:UDP-3-O-[3-hydroxymyristoyl] glucosamine N-acyltransferase
MSHNAASIAEAVRGTLTGDGSLAVRDVLQLPNEAGPEDLVLAMEKHDLPLLGPSGARIAMIASGMPVPAGLAACIEVRRPRHALAILLRLFERPVHAFPGRHHSAVIDPTATLGSDVSVGAFVRVGAGAKIGRNTILMPHVVIGAEASVGEDCLFHAGVQVGERVRIGNRVILQMNATIGADGFSFVSSAEVAKTAGEVRSTKSPLQRVNSIGSVVLGDDVELGACTTIDRSTIADTVIGRGTKIDNLVMVAHNCAIGENCMISGQTGIAGSCEIGNRVVLGGKTGVADHLRVGDDAVVAGRGGVLRHVPPKAVLIGGPAEPHAQTIDRLRNEARMSRYLARVDDLHRRINLLEGKPGDTAWTGR